MSGVTRTCACTRSPFRVPAFFVLREHTLLRRHPPVPAAAQLEPGQRTRAAHTCRQSKSDCAAGALEGIGSTTPSTPRSQDLDCRRVRHRRRCAVQGACCGLLAALLRLPLSCDNIGFGCELLMSVLPLAPNDSVGRLNVLFFKLNCSARCAACWCFTSGWDRVLSACYPVAGSS